LAPFHIGREALEKFYVNFRWFLGQNLKPDRACAVYAAASLFDQTGSLQEHIRPRRSVYKSSLAATRQHLLQVFFAEFHARSDPIPEL
jgi:hypothetical protein